ncbi:unnamed protein product [Lactuca saligna]|uniref:Uncharacterized protein n=1 Tax=Lactuca saligna TaxID=75948 RepID=A0AA35YWU8_LACSI|nr:unnamed protein product [Lactuca saligna]
MMEKDPQIKQLLKPAHMLKMFKQLHMTKLLKQECGYEPHDIEHDLEKVNVMSEPVSKVQMIEDHLEADLEGDANEIEDNLEMVSEDDEEIDGENVFIEDTQVVGRPRKRKISERNVKIKLKKVVYDKDGGGSSIEKPVNLE